MAKHWTENPCTVVRFYFQTSIYCFLFMKKYNHCYINLSFLVDYYGAIDMAIFALPTRFTAVPYNYNTFYFDIDQNSFLFRNVESLLYFAKKLFI